MSLGFGVASSTRRFSSVQKTSHRRARQVADSRQLGFSKKLVNKHTIFEGERTEPTVIRPQSTASANVTKASGLLQGNCTSDSANVCGCRQGVTVLRL